MTTENPESGGPWVVEARRAPQASLARLWDRKKYSVSSDVGYTASAQTGFVSDATEECENSEARNMNFSIKFRITNEKDGEVFNEGLFVFETRFGVGEVAHEFCELDLEGYEDAQER